MFVRIKSIALAVVAMLAFWVMPVSAATIGFTDFLAPTFWQSQGDLGTIYFANNDTELHIQGPTGLATPFQSSSDSTSYQGQDGAGVPRAGTLTFDYYFNAGDALNAQLDFTDGSQLFTIAAGGPGATSQGTFVVSLDEHSIFAFLFTTLNPSGDKTPGGVVISNVRYHSVPDMGATSILLICSLLPLLVYRKAFGAGSRQNQGSGESVP